MLAKPRTLLKPLREIRRLLHRWDAEPAAEDVHELRTAVSRFDTMLEAMRSDLKRADRQTGKRLARIRRRAGKVRDIDVLTRNAASLDGNLDGNDDADCLAELLEQLGAHRARKARRLRRLVKAKEPTLQRRLKRTAHRVEEQLRPSRHSAANAVADVTANAIALSAELAAPIRLNRTTLHPYRRKVKALRDVLQMAEDAKQNAFVRRLSTVKDVIGDWHDWELLIEVAIDIVPADHGRRCPLVQAMRAVSKTKYEHAVAVAMKLRAVLVRNRDRSERAGSVAQGPALAAIAELAAVR